MSESIYPARVTLCQPGPNGATPAGDVTTPLVTSPAVGGAVVSLTNPTPVKGGDYGVKVSFARPSDTTPYTAGDVVGATAGSAIHEFALAGLTGRSVILLGIDLRIDLAAVPASMSTFRAHFYDAAPDAIADNSPWVISSVGDRGKYLGFVDIPLPLDLGATLWAQVELAKPLKLVTSSVFVLLETKGGYTPTSAESYALRLNTIDA